MNGVALIDHDVAARQWATTALSASGLRVMGFGSAAEFLSVATPPGPPCVVIDGNLPDMTCAHYCCDDGDCATGRCDKTMLGMAWI